MCGICGKVILRNQTYSIDFPLLLHRMTNTLIHRGPDTDGYYFDENVGFGFRRLSIIDLVTGNQPMGNEDGSIQVVFNGEIYNFKEIQQRLLELGHYFRTSSDTEVIVHAYEEYGTDCINIFRGMFALAIWDKLKRILVLARDRVGKKPLYYYYSLETFVFASEIKALLQDPTVPRNVDPQAIDFYLTFKYIPAPNSILQGVKKLLPGHMAILELDSNELKIFPYWDPPLITNNELGFEEASFQLRKHLIESVKLRLISDVPIGALLSGGIDSTIIVALMSQLSRNPIETFTVGFEEEKFNEAAAAKIVAEEYSTVHHEYLIKPDALSILPEIVYYLDEPMADVSVIPTYYVCHQARKSVKVVLTGDGGDETFAGYDSYNAITLYRHYRQLPNIFRKKIIEPLLDFVPKMKDQGNPFERARRLIDSAYLPLSEQFYRWMTLFTFEERKSFYSVDFLQKIFPESVNVFPSEIYLDQYLNIAQIPEINYINLLLNADLRTYLPGDLLVKMDRMSMANSLEARSPFLDQEIIEWSVTLPSTYKIRNGIRKYLLKKTFSDLIPKKLINRPKQGFAVPIDNWIRGDLKNITIDLLLSTPLIGEIFLIDEIKNLFDEHIVGLRNHGAKIWALLLLELWIRQLKTI